jgi:hypothetical protein
MWLAYIFDVSQHLQMPYRPRLKTEMQQGFVDVFRKLEMIFNKSTTGSTSIRLQGIAK